MWRSISRPNPSQTGASRPNSLAHREVTSQWRQTAIPARSFATNTMNAEPFINGTSANYADQMYIAWKKDPSSVHASWNAYFSNVESGAAPGQAFTAPPSFGTPFVSSAGSTATIGDVSVKAEALVRAYQTYGHLRAKLDPLGLTEGKKVPQLTLAHHGLSEKDLNEKINLSSPLGANTTVGELIKKLESTYCKTIGSEYTHIFDETEKAWIRERLEAMPQFTYSKDRKKEIYDRMLWAEKFEMFLATKYGQDKRFGLDGCEIMIPGMKALIDKASDLGVENVVMGMPHRGRLNVLANVVRKPLEAIFKEFVKMSKEDIAKLQEDEFTYFSGDVKYHMGTSYDRPVKSGKSIHLSLMSNPSHLEAVDPLACGKTRAKQHYLKDEDRSRVLCLQLHGDAAFAGQGVVYETLQMAKLNHYNNGGTIHIVVNNQIGFTTDPKDGRSTTYCSDIAKAFDIPILHVNGDDSEAVTFVCEFAAEYRQKYHKDIVIDLICYRRAGHNEQDNPFFTQPTLYKTITSHPSALEIYSKKLNEEGAVTKEEMAGTKTQIDKILETAYAASPQWVDHKSDWLESKWVGFRGPAQLSRIKQTGVSMDMLKKVGAAISKFPAEFTLHKTIGKIMEERKASIDSGNNVDWATAEALAFGTLMVEGNHVRLSGQDVERGTFSHRHAVLHDQNTNQTFTPLAHIDGKQAKFEIANSPLHEYGVMGFELGYSLENPNSLILWEAQFGDFANTAQVIIDQFLSAGEKKWNRQAGLVLLLPHGYDGQGPEHSSARLERFLQLHDGWHADRFENVDPEYEQQIQESNMQIVNCTTPANYFHVLRRQVHREFRKPLVVMSPKSLLRAVKSPLSAFDNQGDDTRFYPVIGEVSQNLVAPEKIRKLIFCSGQVYYQLAAKRDADQIKDIAIVRIEQLAPFPFKAVMEEVKRYPNAQLTWCQEEPNNMGAWWFVDNHFSSCLKGAATLSYVGRPVSASPAAGTYTKHQRELYKMLKDAMA